MCSKPFFATETHLHETACSCSIPQAVPMEWPHLGCLMGWSLHCVDSWAITWLTDSWPWPKWCCGSWLQFNGVVDGAPAPVNVPWQCLIYQHQSNLCLLSSRVMLNISNRMFYFLKTPYLCHAGFYMNLIYVLGECFYYSCRRNVNLELSDNNEKNSLVCVKQFLMSE